MTAWQSAFKIAEVKSLIQAAQSEATLAGDGNESSSDNQIEDDLPPHCYYNKQDKVYKMFKDGEWVSLSDKPAAEQKKEKKDEPSPVDPKSEEKRLKRQRAKDNKKKKWQEAKSHTFVYATGLPPDVTEDELLVFFKKCGRIARDPHGF